jgi:hypothetical protein
MASRGAELEIDGSEIELQIGRLPDCIAELQTALPTANCGADGQSAISTAIRNSPMQSAITQSAIQSPIGQSPILPTA